MRFVLVPACSRIYSPLMRGQICHPFLVHKSSLGSIPMMGIIVQYGDALHSALEGIPCSDRNVVEKTESHRAIRFCMMSRRTDQSECVLSLPAKNCAHTLQGPAAGEQSITERCVRHKSRCRVNDPRSPFTKSFQIGDEPG